MGYKGTLESHKQVLQHRNYKPAFLQLNW